MSRSDRITATTVDFAHERIDRLREAVDTEAYSAGAEFADEIALLLRTLNERLVSERVGAARE